MTYPHDYTPAQRLAHEVRILLTLIELEEEAGPDLTGVFLYQREKIYDLIKGDAPEPTLPGYMPSMGTCSDREDRNWMSDKLDQRAAAWRAEA